eukprot:7483610-Pyramimonas_sp.AAC.1
MRIQLESVSLSPLGRCQTTPGPVLKCICENAVVKPVLVNLGPPSRSSCRALPCPSILQPAGPAGPFLPMLPAAVAAAAMPVRCLPPP